MNLDEINPGVRRTVEWLNRHGFKTIDSGDGATNIPTLGDEALRYPHVMMTCEPHQLIGETMRLKMLLTKARVEIVSLGVAMSVEGEAPKTLTEALDLPPPKPCMQATFDPGDGSAVIGLVGVDDAVLFSQSVTK